MAINCEKLEAIVRDCSNALGGIDQRIFMNDSKNVAYDDATVVEHIITGLALESTADGFETIEFRKNLATLTEDYASAPDGAVMFNQTLVIPIHGRDAAKSKKISIMASGQRELDIIIPQNGGGYVYLREATLSAVADGTGAAKGDGSKYTLTFTAQAETLAYFIESDIVDGVLEPIIP
jgi:hypothetical protein